MEPTYTPNLFDVSAEELEAIPWVDRTHARRECFMSVYDRKYTYGSGDGQRTYSSVSMHGWVWRTMTSLNAAAGDYHNVCFLNKYEGREHGLGWHSDDSPDTDGEHPIAVVSFGEPREIWWRPKGRKGEVPPECRRLLEPGSLFVMPPGFQSTHEHRIPKGSREMSWRVSLTFRKML